MINLEFQTERMWQGLQLHRFHIHKEEVKRVLQPVLQEVYDCGFERGVADSSNNIFVPEVDKDVLVTKKPEPFPAGTIEAQVEVIRHEPEEVKEFFEDFQHLSDETITTETENVD